MKPALLLLSLSLTMSAANYSIENAVVDGVAIVRLGDAAHKTQVSIVPSIGNNAFEMKVNGKDVLWSPYKSVGEFQKKHAHLGVPFLAPWANRIAGDSYYVNGKKYTLNPALQNFQYDGNHNPIHGLVVYASEWKVVRTHADDKGAEVTSRLEFWRRPDWMAQFPFAHNMEMTYRLKDGVLEVITTIENLSSEPMPVALGYHPYFTLSDSPRDSWKVHLPVKEHLVLNDKLIPTGEHKPNELPDPMPLQGNKLDDGFSGLVRNADGRAEFWVQGKNEKVSVLYGPKYPIAVVYAPPGRNFICFEPMAAPTNAYNLAHEGKYNELQSVSPGGKWTESFWIRPSGF